MLSPNAERDLLQQVRYDLVRRLVAELLTRSWLRVVVIGLLTCLFWAGMFWIFQEGFDVLGSAISNKATQAQTIHAIFNVFFMSLLAMLAVSSGIIMYGLLFDSDDVRFLLTTPVRTERIVLHKFQEAIVLSCWGFILLGSPLLVAYGVEVEAPWYYFALLPWFVVSFAFLPTGVGAIACLLLTRYLPRRRLHVLISVCIILLAFMIYVGWSTFSISPNDMMTPLWFQDVMARLRHSEQRLSPSYWLSSGLLEAAHPTPPSADVLAWRESLGFLSVLVSNALLMPVAVAWCGGRLLRPAYSQLKGIGRASRTTHESWMDRAVMCLTKPFPMPVRLLLVKDLKLFRRDPLRWTQFLVFFGLLAIYFINVRRFNYRDTLDSWMTIIGFLNLAVLGLIHSTFTTRFVFPLISMEGRRFWILGTLPVDRDLVLWSKLLFACATSVIPSLLLIGMSDWILQITARTPLIAALHVLMALQLTVGLSSIAVGMGAKYPNLREPSPAKIAAGFGGTLNLILSTLYILVSVSVIAIPGYLWVERQSPSGLVPTQLADTYGSPMALGLGIATSLLLGIAATVIPLRIGLRAFRQLEPA